jgi:hypothetical protein
MRGLLLNKPGVFSLDLKNQENRMTAYIIEDVKAAELFIQGRDQHQEEADRLGVTRDVGKTTVHALTYDQKGPGLAKGFLITSSCQ